MLVGGGVCTCFLIIFCLSTGFCWLCYAVQVRLGARIDLSGLLVIFCTSGMKACWRANSCSLNFVVDFINNVQIRYDHLLA